MSERTLAQVSGMVFDLDGTLVDTTYIHALCWWEALQQFGHIRTMASLHRAVGMGSDNFLRHTLGPERDTSSDEDLTKAHDVLFATWHERVQPLPGARQLLTWCRDAGLTVALASSSGERDLWALLEVLDYPDFDVIITAKDVEDTKPSPDLFVEAMKRGGLTPQDVLVVGDAVWDIESAMRLGAPSVGLECGGTSAAELREAGAALTFRDPDGLLHALQDVGPQPLTGRPLAPIPET